jgi:PAS domain S-box-containing protein
MLRGDLVGDVRALLQRGAEDHWARLRANVRHAMTARRQDVVAISALTGLASGTVRGFLQGRPSSIRNVLLIAESVGYTLAELDQPPDLFRQRASQSGVGGDGDGIGRSLVAFERATTGMAILLLDGTIVKVNRRLREILGYEEGELIGAQAELFLVQSEEDRAARSAEWGAGRAVSERLSRLRRKDGSLVPALVSALLVRDEDEQPHYVVARGSPVATATGPEASSDEPGVSDSSIPPE